MHQHRKRYNSDRLMVLFDKLRSIPVSIKYANPPEVFITTINELNFKAKYLCLNAE